MIIRCWGARGSIPVSGKEYIKYGGDTTCMEIRTKDDDIIIIDAGSGIRKLGNKLLDEKRFQYTMIFTHAHWDHIMGFPFFRPIYFKKTSITMLGCPFAQSSVKHMISKIMAPPNFPIRFEDIKSEFTYREICENQFHVNSMTITPISLSHPNQGQGFKFEEDGKSFVFLTDNELSFKHPGGLDFQDYLVFSTGADLLIHDAEYREEEYKHTKTWGHSVYKDALKLAVDAGVRKFGLFHHNQERFDQAVDNIVEECRKTVKGSQANLECFALYQGMEIEL
jgi:phosphoribosyl 1,2-cyclic phosphodiesterase